MLTKKQRSVRNSLKNQPTGSKGLKLIPCLPRSLNKLQIIASNLALQEICRKNQTMLWIFYLPKWIRAFIDLDIGKLNEIRGEIAAIDEVGEYIQIQTRADVKGGDALKTYIRTEAEKGFKLSPDFSYVVADSMIKTFDPEINLPGEANTISLMEEMAQLPLTNELKRKPTIGTVTLQDKPLEKKIHLSPQQKSLNTEPMVESQFVREKQEITRMEGEIDMSSELLRKYPDLNLQGYCQQLEEIFSRKQNTVENITKLGICFTRFSQALTFLLDLLRIRSKQTSTLDGKMTGRSFGTYLVTITQPEGQELIQPANCPKPHTMSLQTLVDTLQSQFGYGTPHQYLTLLGVDDYGEGQKKHYHVVISFGIKEQTNFKVTLLNQVRLNLLQIPDLNYSLADAKAMSAYMDVAVPKEDSTNDSIHWKYILDKVIENMDLMSRGLLSSDRELPLVRQVQHYSTVKEEAIKRMGGKVEPIPGAITNQTKQVEHQGIDDYFNDARSRHESVFSDAPIKRVISNADMEKTYGVKAGQNPLKNEKLMLDLIKNPEKISSLPVQTQFQYQQLTREFVGFIQDSQPQSFYVYLREHQFHSRRVYESLVNDPDLKSYADDIRSFLSQNVNLVQWCYNVAIPPKLQAQSSEEGKPVRTVLFIHGKTGIGKSFFAHQVILGGTNGMKYLSIPMNPKQFIGATTIKVASANAYHLFLNDEANFEINSKFAYADLKRLWEGGLYFNVKYGVLSSQYFYRLPFMYLTNQTISDMKLAISTSLEDNQQIIDSFYNRLLVCNLEKGNNQYFLKQVTKNINLRDIHALFWTIMVQDFKIMPEQEAQLLIVPSKYEAIMKTLEETKPEEKQKEPEPEKPSLQCPDTPFDSLMAMDEEDDEIADIMKWLD